MHLAAGLFYFLLVSFAIGGMSRLFRAGRCADKRSRVIRANFAEWRSTLVACALMPPPIAKESGDAQREKPRYAQGNLLLKAS
ncbi:hypothetical protein FVF58_12610 [Paraburkholderia panacisoli]|uniref:Uncharacterized protein n=1 Tax=Paraburkholderia panacisoli TaxID=2603818 RepID=A0A5B0HA78_9BURK|nr:hypothetical protein [Paraburkholderia panacisoli]KAA1011960.1 hypothetical protein FVF58_12610 [Paraburkholderia panacisoli]